MSELILNLSSERIFVSLIRQDKPMNISNRGSLNESRSYFDSFAICKDELTYDHLQISESSKINLSSLVYPLDFMASNSNNSMVEKVSDYQNFRIIPSKDDHLVYVKDEASISPEEIERFILEDIVKRIENKGVTITKLSVIIPDSFEQQKRVTLFSIIQSFFPHPTSIRFINASVAAISCLSQDFLSSSPSIAVVLHMDSGHFDISIYSDLRKDTASCCFSASCNIGGIDIVNKSYEYFLQDISKEKPIKKSEIQKNYLIINWMKIKNMILDNNDDILSLRMSMSQSYDYSSEYTEKAIQDIIPILIHTIETSIQLAGIQPRDVGFVILSGIWNTVLPFEAKTRSLFPLAKYHNFTAFDLNSSITVSKTNYRHISPCLSTAWGLAYATEKKLIADRFVTFPYKSEGVFSFTPVEDDKYLTLFAIPLDSTKQINIKKYDLSPFCIFGKKMTIWYTISVDRNGILSEEIYCDANKHKRIYNYNSSVCFKFHYLLYLSEDNKMEIVADRPIDTVINESRLIIKPLGAGREVGRSCIYMSYKGKVILFDCGILPSCTGKGSLPFLDNINDDYVDLVLISHFHLDHCGALPVLPERSFFHTGKNGERRTRIFMTIPTRGIMKSLLHDYLSISSGEGNTDAIYNVEQLDACINDIETINYHEERWHNGIKITCFQAGHVLGAAMFMVEIDSIRVLYTGDFSREEDRHLPAAEVPPSFLRPNIVICESTYGRAAHEDRKTRENELVKCVAATIRRRGKVLLPVFALGRTQELLLLLNEYWDLNPEMKRIGKIIYLNQLAVKSMYLFRESINMMNQSIRSQVRDHNPFDLPNVEIPDNVEEWLDQEFPKTSCVVLCSPAMMENGTSRLVLEQMADNENNLVILTGYCMAGTIARQLREGEHIIPLLNGNAGETVNVRCTIKTISFSAHSDFPGTSSFIKDTQPDYVVLVHGEASRMEDLKEGLLNTMQSYVKFNDVYCPGNANELCFNFKTPKYIKIVGNAAIMNCDSKPVVNGILVKKDFKYQLMEEEDISTFTQLKVCRILYRQHFKSQLDMNAIFAVCSMNAKTIEMDVSKQSIVVDGKITISLHDCQNGIYSYSIEWMSNYEVDLKANALLVLIMQQDVNILSPFNTDSLYKSSTDDKSSQVSEFTPSCINSSEEIQQLIYSVLEEQFGPITLDQNPQFWNIELPNGIQLSINSKNWDVDGSDAVIVDSVKEAINMVLEVV